MQQLYEELVKPISWADTKGAWFRGRTLVSLDRTTFDVADDPALAAAFGRPENSHGETALPQVRMVGFVENGAHVLFPKSPSLSNVTSVSMTPAPG